MYIFEERLETFLDNILNVLGSYDDKAVSVAAVTNCHGLMLIYQGDFIELDIEMLFTLNWFLIVTIFCTTRF